MSEVKFINMSEADFLDNNMLYKYMPLEMALATVNDKYIWFNNPCLWNDPFEKRFINATYILDKKEIDFPLKDRIFCTCMTQTTTSEAHWKAYSGNDLGISFKYKRSKLLEILNQHTSDYEIYIGKVDYLRTKDIKKKISEIEGIKDIVPLSLYNRELQIKLVLLKRIAFKYENEIRIIIIKKYKTEQKGIKLVFKNNANELIDRITLDPSVGVHTEKMLKELFKETYHIPKVYKSELYTMKSDVKIEL